MNGKCANCGADTHWQANAIGGRAKRMWCEGCWNTYVAEQRKQERNDPICERVRQYAGRTPYNSRPNHPQQDELTQDQLTAMYEDRDPYYED